MNFTRQYLLPLIMGVVLLWIATVPVIALQPDELLLITNSNMPEGRELAEVYARHRGVPEGRILQLPLPKGETMSAEAYHRQVVPAVRDYLQAQGLKDQVKCLVTFYGVPLRIAARRLDEDAQAELRSLKEQQEQLLLQVQKVVAELEQLASRVNDAFKPPPRQPADNVAVLARRADVAMRQIEAGLANQPPEVRQPVIQEVVRTVELLLGPAGVLERVQVNPHADPDAPGAAQFAEMKQAVEAASQRLQQLQAEQQEPQARAETRELAARYFGLLNTAQIVAAHIAILDAEQTAAAFDSELALLWWDNYPKSRWVFNPLHYAVTPEQAAQAPPTLMTSRIDAPTPDIAHRVIIDTIETEQEGLSGNVGIDIGGSFTLGPKSGPNQYRVWDDHLRSFARLVENHTDFKLIMDQAAGVFTPGTVPNCALYCGWYSVRNYVPAFEFARGAVAYHIASFELRAMRAPEEKGWVPNLLRDGVVSTIGAVEEPYLQSFPRPDDFFGLLMTGRLTLAEVYWATTPMVSWKQVLIGDPLYRPFATNPALSPDVLPDHLQKVVQKAPEQAKHSQ